MKTANKSRNSSNVHWLFSKGSLKKHLIIGLFVLSFAALGSYLIFTSQAASQPRFWGNDLFWSHRIRACESGDGVYGKSNYQKVGGAYGYSDEEWNNYAGVARAQDATPVDQDAKFITDWNNSGVGSNPWKDSLECWKPAGLIKSAPCMPVPKNGDHRAETVNNQTNPIQADNIEE